MNKVPISEYYIQAMDEVSKLIDSQTDQQKKSRHKEFIEDGFFGTRHRLREPFELYMSSSKESDAQNQQIRYALARMAAESIMLLGECLKVEELELRVITFKDEEDAKKVLSLLKTEIIKKGFVSQSMYYSVCGIETTSEMNYLVWTSLDSVRVMHIEESYFLDLPKPIEIRIKE